MRKNLAVAIFAAAAIAAVGCGNDEDEFVVGQFTVPSPSPIASPSPTPVVPATNFVGLDSTGTALLRFSNTSTTAPTRTPLTNLTAGFSLVGLDYRPQTNGLYGLGFNPTTSAVQLFSINADNGRADAVGAASSAATPITGTAFGFDFNPSVDRIRVTTDTGLNFRMNPNNGAIVDGVLDGAVNGQTTRVDGAAYTNNQPNNGGVTTLYTIDASTGRLFIQNPPNAGTEVSGLPITAAGGQLTFSSVNGFDIGTGINAPANNSPVTSGSGFVALTTGTASQLYSLNLVTGQATPLGSLPESLRGLTIQDQGAGRPLVGLDAAGAQLVRFSSTNPNGPTTANITGITTGEQLVGIDFRPATGQLYGLGINAGADNGSVYLLDPQTGAATVIGTAGAIRYTTAAGNVVDLPPSSSGYGIDFNPTVDRMRVTTGTGINARVNQTDGTPIDGDTAANGTQPDGAINGLPAGSTGVSGAGYTNNFSGATNTTLYTIDSTTGTLYQQNPANAGTQTAPVPLRLNGNAVPFTAVNGFEIARPSGPQILIFPASDPGYVALTNGTTTTVYTLNLLTGALTSLGSTAFQLAGLTGGN